MFFSIILMVLVLSESHASDQWTPEIVKGVLGLDMEHISVQFLQTEGYAYAKRMSEIKISHMSDDSVAIENHVLPFAQAFYHNHQSDFEGCWFNSFGRIESLVDEWVLDGSPHEKAFMRLLLYLNMVDYQWSEHSLFRKAIKPNLEGKIRDIFRNYLMNHKSYKFMLGDFADISLMDYYVSLENNVTIMPIPMKWENIQEEDGCLDVLDDSCSIAELHAHDKCLWGKKIYDALLSSVLSDAQAHWVDEGLKRMLLGCSIFQGMWSTFPFSLSQPLQCWLCHDDLYIYDERKRLLIQQVFQLDTSTEEIDQYNTMLEQYMISLCAGLPEIRLLAQQGANMQELGRNWGVDVAESSQFYTNIVSALLKYIYVLECQDFSENVLLSSPEKQQRSYQVIQWLVIIIPAIGCFLNQTLPQCARKIYFSISEECVFKIVNRDVLLSLPCPESIQKMSGFQRRECLAQLLAMLSEDMYKDKVELCYTKRTLPCQDCFFQNMYDYLASYEERARQVAMMA